MGGISLLMCMKLLRTDDSQVARHEHVAKRNANAHRDKPYIFKVVGILFSDLSIEIPFFLV